MTDDTKATLRQLFRARRQQFVAALDDARRLALAHDMARIAAPVTAGFALIGSYAAVGSEIDPVAIEAGFPAIAFPRVAGSAMQFHQAPFDELVPGGFGIPQPRPDAPLAAPDLLLVPLVGVAPNGTRLGQGQGHYDRALAAMRQTRPVRTVALAWDVQIADTLPADPWDIPVDFIATPTRLFDCERLR